MRSINNRITMRASSICFLLYILLKPFYIYHSGSIQPSDFILLVSFVFLVIQHKDKLIRRIDYSFLLFLMFVIVINLTYGLIYSSFSFVWSILYYIFSFIVIISFRHYLEEGNYRKGLILVCKINIIVQLVLYVTKIGKYWLGTYRYMGSYTDPNQMGFAIFSTLAILFLLDSKDKYIFGILSAFLIYKTASGGMFIALVILVSFDLFVSITSSLSSPRKMLYGFGLIIFVTILLIIGKRLDINVSVFRLDEKMNREGTMIYNFLKDRLLLIVVEQPQFFLIGYGEGPLVSRFGRVGELHSTWISLAYNYGIVPFLILINWIRKNIKGIQFKYVPVYIALFVEALTLVNHRQPSFWMIIMLGTLLRGNKENE